MAAKVTEAVALAPKQLQPVAADEASPRPAPTKRQQRSAQRLLVFQEAKRKELVAAQAEGLYCGPDATLESRMKQATSIVNSHERLKLARIAREGAQARGARRRRRHGSGGGGRFRPLRHR